MLTMPEVLLGKDSCHPDRTPEESRQRMEKHFQGLFPDADGRLFDFLFEVNIQQMHKRNRCAG